MGRRTIIMSGAANIIISMFFPPFRNTFFPPNMKRGRSDLLPPAKFPVDPFRGLLIDECVCRLVCTFYRFTYYFLYDIPSPFFPPFLDDGRPTDNSAESLAPAPRWHARRRTDNSDKSLARSTMDIQFCDGQTILANHGHTCRRTDNSAKSLARSWTTATAT